MLTPSPSHMWRRHDGAEETNKRKNEEWSADAQERTKRVQKHMHAEPMPCAKYAQHKGCEKAEDAFFECGHCVFPTGCFWSSLKCTERHSWYSCRSGGILYLYSCFKLKTYRIWYVPQECGKDCDVHISLCGSSLESLGSLGSCAKSLESGL